MAVMLLVVGMVAEMEYGILPMMSLVAVAEVEDLPHMLKMLVLLIMLLMQDQLHIL